jgi:hypothetical protein
MKNETARLKSPTTSPDQMLIYGSTADKYPVMLDDRKTIIFISDKSKEDEIRQRYALLSQNTITR